MAPRELLDGSSFLCYNISMINEQLTLFETRKGLLRITPQTLSALFDNQCDVERVIITDNDRIHDTITLIISNHPKLPKMVEGRVIPYVRCEMKKNEDGSLGLNFI